MQHILTTLQHVREARRLLQEQRDTAKAECERLTTVLQASGQEEEQEASCPIGKVEDPARMRSQL